MTIAVGDALPDVTAQTMTADGGDSVNLKEWAAGKTAVLFAVPGAFTPTCSEAHLPGFVAKSDDLKAKGVEAMACISVNDAFVMKAWGEAQNADGLVTMLADGDGAVAKALGLEMQTGTFGGLRSKRFAMVLKDGVVTYLGVDEGGFEKSSAEAVLAAL